MTCQLSADTNGVVASKAILRFSTIIAETPLLYHRYTASIDARQILIALTEVCCEKKLTEQILTNAYYFHLHPKVRGLTDAQTRTFKDKLGIMSILQMYTHNCTSNLAFGFHSGIALYELCGKMNHSCDPNAMLIFTHDEKSNGTVYCVALRDIAENEEIVIDYTLNTQLSSRIARQIGIRNNISNFTCTCARCLREVEDTYLLNQKDIAVLYSNQTKSAVAELEEILGLPMNEVSADTEVMRKQMACFLNAYYKFKPENQAADLLEAHKRCAMDITVIFAEKVSRTFGYVGYDCSGTSTKTRNEEMKNFLKSLPVSYWEFIDSDARTCMRMFSVILVCHSEDLPEVKKLDKKTEEQLKLLSKCCDERNAILLKFVPQHVLQLCSNYVFQWLFRKLGSEYLQMHPFIDMFLNECNCLDALQPAKLALQKVLWLTQTLMFV